MAHKTTGIIEATVTSKGQITVPSEIREALKVDVGDKIQFLRSRDGKITIEARKRRSIIDIARENPLPPGDYNIDEAITEAMIRREKRARPKASR